MLETQKAKVNLADIQTELELGAEKLMNEAQQKLELSKIDEEIAKAKAVKTFTWKKKKKLLCPQDHVVLIYQGFQCDPA